MALWKVGTRDRDGVEGDWGLVGLGRQVHFWGRVGEGQGESSQDGSPPRCSSRLVLVAGWGEVSVKTAAQAVAVETPGGQLLKPQSVLAVRSAFL